MRKTKLIGLLLVVAILVAIAMFVGGLPWGGSLTVK
jgi:hypothetical protein